MFKLFSNRKRPQDKKANLAGKEAFKVHVYRTFVRTKTVNSSMMKAESAAGVSLPDAPDPSLEPARYLRSIHAVRAQATIVLAKTRNNNLKHFNVNMGKLRNITSYVASIIERDYGHDLSSIPPHGRWQHFEVGGVARIDQLLQFWSHCDVRERTRRLLDLFVVSVLLDAGAGPTWQYLSNEGLTFNRTEGLGVASIEMFRAGLFSSSSEEPHRVDAVKLKSLTPEQIGKAFQVTDSNVMDGLEGRASLLVALGHALDDNKVFFGNDGRPGNMLDYLLLHPTTRGDSTAPIVAIPTLWNLLMDGLAPIWPPSRTHIGQVSLGDAWPLSTLLDYDPQHLTWKSVMPFHKLTQWLCYSLMQPMTRLLAVEFAGSQLLTGLAEYRNGGLLIDCGLLSLKHADARRGLNNYAENAQYEGQPNVEVVPCFEPADEVVVEWRAVTVGMLDVLLVEVNKHLGLDGSSAQKMPLTLAQLLEAGTWKGGREIAQIQRPNTRGPPIMILSDGTVF